LGDGVETLKAKNLYWVVMSYHFVVTRWPLANEKITIETYPGLTKAFIYPRHYVVYDEKGEIIVRGISLWAVLDHQSHKPTIPPANGVAIAPVHKEGELPWPPRQVLEGLSVKENRLVRNSDLDFNGHMNNIRYVDFALDSDDLAFYSSHIPSEFQITFSSETTLGATMEIASSLTDSLRNYQGQSRGEIRFLPQRPLRKLSRIPPSQKKGDFSYALKNDRLPLMNRKRGLYSFGSKKNLL
jgi:acyl-ACP thioesterase